MQRCYRASGLRGCCLGSWWGPGSSGWQLDTGRSSQRLLLIICSLSS
jgi:hypothetical protein